MKKFFFYLQWYWPIVLSAYSGAYFLGIFFNDFSAEELKTMAASAFFLSMCGWGTVFMVEEDIRKLIVAVQNTVAMINKMLEEQDSEEETN